jgi:hypothetical protein
MKKLTLRRLAGLSHQRLHIATMSFTGSAMGHGRSDMPQLAAQ